MYRLVNLIFFIFTVNTYCKKILNGTIITVNEEPVLLSDINEQKMFLQYSNMNKNNTKEIKDEDILDKIVRNKLIKTHYSKLLDDPNIKTQMDSQINYIELAISQQARNILQMYFANDEDAFYKELGCSVDDYIRNSVESQKEQMITTLIIQKITNSENISPKKLRDFYDNMSEEEKNKNFKTDKNKYIVCELVVKNKQSENINKLIKDIKKEIDENPNDFDNIIKKYSNEDTNMGDVDIFDFNSPLCFYISKLKENQISDIISIDNAYYILKCNKIDKNIRNISCLTLYNNLFDEDENKAIEMLKSIKKDIENNKITWCSAVRKYSQNKDNINFAGAKFGKNYNELLIDDDLSEQELDIINKLKPGEISEPFIQNINDTKVYKILFLKNKINSDDISFENNFDKIKEIYTKKQNKDFFKKKTDSLFLTEDIVVDLGYDICKKFISNINKK